jgi:hypothetical protein
VVYVNLTLNKGCANVPFCSSYFLRLLRDRSLTESVCDAPEATVEVPLSDLDIPVSPMTKQHKPVDDAPGGYAQVHEKL